MLKLYNTLTRQIENFIPLAPPKVGLYTCGPTVYNFQHIGNLRTYVFEDILHRTLLASGYDVTHVMNITDVGHLTDDADAGEDKMEKGSRREGKSAWEIAEFYTKVFQQDLQALNILPPDVWCKATDHIPEQIAQVQTLTDKGYTYVTSDGIYFDTTKLSDYGKLARLDKQQLQAGTRVAMAEKRNPHDFALWKFTAPDEKRQMEWEAFGRKGFPGWHIECSAMSVKYLGEQFDIHCGGIDHIPVHHTNELAQAEATTGITPWVRFWLHGEHLLIGEDKMAKSGDNFIILDTVRKKGISPLAYRYYLLQTHYRKQLNFSREALTAAETGLHNLRREIQKLPEGAENLEFIEKFFATIGEDLNTPQALALLWEAVKEKTITRATVEKCETILGLDLLATEISAPVEIPEEVKNFLNERAEARAAKNWVESDRLRDAIAALGFIVEDTASGQIIAKAK